MESSNYFPLVPLFIIFVVILARRPATHLRRRGAVNPETAVAVDEMSASERRRFDRLVRQGIIKESAPGHYYYDAEGQRRNMMRMLPWLIGLIVLLAALAVGLGWFASSARAR